jgi:enoyl-CoA hydratase/carnithine racemase
MVTGRTLTPDEALQWGLVNRVWEANVFMDETMKYAKGLTYPEHAGRAVGLIKRSVVEGMEMSIKEGLALERELQNRLFAMADAKEGFRAFLEKRKAVFQGK